MMVAHRTMTTATSRRRAVARTVRSRASRVRASRRRSRGRSRAHRHHARRARGHGRSVGAFCGRAAASREERVARARASLDGVRRVRNTTFVKCLVFYAQRDIFETRRRGAAAEATIT